MAEVEYSDTVSDHRRENTRSEVTGRVNGETSLSTECHSETKKNEEKDDRDEAGWRWTILAVEDGEQDED